MKNKILLIIGICLFNTTSFAVEKIFLQIDNDSNYTVTAYVNTSESVLNYCAYPNESRQYLLTAPSSGLGTLVDDNGERELLLTLTLKKDSRESNSVWNYLNIPKSYWTKDFKDVDVNPLELKNVSLLELYVIVDKNGNYEILNGDGDNISEGHLPMPLEDMALNSLNKKQTNFYIDKNFSEVISNKIWPKTISNIIEKYVGNKKMYQYKRGRILLLNTTEDNWLYDILISIKGHIEFYKYNTLENKYIKTKEDQNFQLSLNNSNSIYYDAKQSNNNDFKYMQKIVIEDIKFLDLNNKRRFRNPTISSQDSIVLDEKFTDVSFDIDNNTSAFVLEISLPNIDDFNDDERHNVLIEQGDSSRWNEYENLR